MTTPRLDLMEDLAMKLESLTDEERQHFNMYEWAYAPNGFDPERWPEQIHECGSLGCAIGWGATLPSWREAGFRLKKHETHGIHGYIVPRGSSYLKIGRFLGISKAAAETLFNASAYTPYFGCPIPPLAVASRIRAFIAHE